MSITETRTTAVSEALHGLQSYQKIKSRATELLAVEHQSLCGLEASLRQDVQLAHAWEQVKQALTENRTLWYEICRNWHSIVTRSVIPPNTFPHGGNRYSTKHLSRKQQALVKYVEAQALAAPETEDDDKVADQCVDEVDRRWRTSDPDGMTVVRRVVRTVTRQVRRRNRNGDDEESSDESLELFEKLEKQNIEDITVHPGQSSSTSWFDNLKDMKHIDHGLLMKLVDLKTVEVQSQLESRRVEVEPERLRAEAALVTAQTAANHCVKKRVAS
jgi:hypothetical protein